MNSFQSEYYANHVKFIEYLSLHIEKIDELETNKFLVTKEELYRDLASRAYYTAFLKIRDTLNLPQETMHSSLPSKLSSEYKNILKELKEIRVKADYYTSEEFDFPVKLKKGRQFYSMRIIALMDKVLNANLNNLTP